MDKRLIAERFARARNTYTREARVQQQVAEKMMRLVARHMAASPTTESRPARIVVEFGCGTGSYSRLLAANLHPERLLLNDLCPEMADCLSDLTEKSGGKVLFLPGDAESLTFPENTSLITSCSTLQWFTRPAHFFTRCHDALAPDGLLAFSTFGQENMREICHLTGHGLNYLPIRELAAMLSPDFELLHAEEELATLYFPTPSDVLRHLKQTGVTGTEKRIWTRNRLMEFCTAYQARFCNEKQEVSLTYHPIYLIARKKTKKIII